jgi:hypothetical protein
MHPALSNLERGRAAVKARGVAIYVGRQVHPRDAYGREPFFSRSAEFEWPHDGSGISAFLCRQDLKAIVAAPTNLCELALGQSPFGRCHGNCLNAALVLCDRPQLRNIGRLTCGRVCARLALWGEHSRRLISFAELPRSKGRLIRDMLLENVPVGGRLGMAFIGSCIGRGSGFGSLNPPKLAGRRCGRLEGCRTSRP